MTAPCGGHRDHPNPNAQSRHPADVCEGPRPDPHLQCHPDFGGLGHEVVVQGPLESDDRTVREVGECDALGAR